MPAHDGFLLKPALIVSHAYGVCNLSSQGSTSFRVLRLFSDAFLPIEPKHSAPLLFWPYTGITNRWQEAVPVACRIRYLMKPFPLTSQTLSYKEFGWGKLERVTIEQQDLVTSLSCVQLQKHSSSMTPQLLSLVHYTELRTLPGFNENENHHYFE